MQKSLPETHTFDQLVVIGASAGGIDALSTLVATLSRDFPAPIVIAQHLDPAHASHLGEILARRGPLPVRTVTDHEALQPGVVFVVPANRHVEITDHAVGLRADDQGRSKPSVDLLLSSAAAIFGERLIAVILTGSGSDGTAGARAVKAAGGTVVIQDPATAAYPSMPRSLAPTTVDIVADLERIGPLLGDLLTGATPAAGAVDRESAATEEEALAAVLAQVRARQGLDFTQYKAPTILRRLQRRVAATGVGALTAYGAYLDGHPAEYRRLVSSFLINVTEFFRDAALFDELRDHALPELIAQARARGNELRLWSAGCATGEEAYSLAILVAEALGDELEGFTVRLFATDLDADAIAFARRGVYAASALATMPDDLRARYFTPVDGAYEVTKRVRGLVVFGEHDLGQRPPFPRVDLALCRNVLIYFTPDLQTRALQLFAFALRTGGYLALGTAETPHALAAYFTAAHPRLKIYRRTGAPAPVPPTWRRGGTGSPPLRALAGGAPAHGAGPVTSNPAADGAALDLVMDERTMPAAPADLLAEIPWGVVVVDRRYDIQSINRAARHLLGIYRKAVGEDLIHLAPNAPAAPLRAAIDTAFRDAAPTRVEEIMPVTLATGEERSLQLVCQPCATDPTGVVAAVMVLVSDITETERATARHRAETDRLTEQARRLAAANRDLLAANDVLTGDTARLRRDTDTARVDTVEAQAHTEEVITLNEELQATNEEMETLNEELQATVEEVQTTNVELEARRVEAQDLATALEAERTQLAVILADIGDAVLVVGPTGVIVRTNPAYARLAGGPDASLRPEDARGQPLPAGATPQARAGRGEAFRLEFTVPAADGTRRWYEANGQPLHDHGLEVGVVVIRDVTVASEQRRLQDEFLALASHELRTPVTAVGGYLDLLLERVRGGSDDERVVHYVTRARAQMKRLGLLVRDLTDVTRLQTGKLTLAIAAVDLSALALQVVETARDLPPGHTIRLDGATVPLRVAGDAGRLEQVLLNLLTNAFAHAPSEAAVEVRLRRVDGEAALEVQDHGQGIAADQVPHLFTRFYQVARPDRPSQGGLGLGLFICQEVVAAHGGRIAVASTPGAGATFTVWLPLLEDEAGGARG